MASILYVIYLHNIKHVLAVGLTCLFILILFNLMVSLESIEILVVPSTCNKIIRLLTLQLSRFKVIRIVDELIDQADTRKSNFVIRHFVGHVSNANLFVFCLWVSSFDLDLLNVVLTFLFELLLLLFIFNVASPNKVIRDVE